MPIIDALEFVRNKKRLPTEAFFVDTNVVLDYADPFGRSLDRASFSRRNEETRSVMHWLRSDHKQAYTTVSVALEYYKAIQVGFYQIFVDQTNPKSNPSPFDAQNFKRLRNSDPQFIESWSNQLKVFKRTFTKSFPLYNANFDLSVFLSDFDGNMLDFGDHVLFQSAMSCEPEFRCIFSNDADFYSVSDVSYLLTTNSKVIARGKKDSRVWEP